MNPDNPSTDVVDFLKSQHDDVEELLGLVQTSGDAQREAFSCLVRLLAVHETAEEEVIHPVAKAASGGEAIVDARLEEESEAKTALAKLEGMEVGSAEFDSAFKEFAADVKTHAEHEEHDEFPLLIAEHTAEVRERLERMVKVAERIAPTHAHPHAPQGPVANLIVGPFVAVADRFRDAFQTARSA